MQEQLSHTLLKSASLLFPSVQPDAYIKSHVWRDSNYVGFADGTVAAWKGWSINFAEIDDRYRTFYIDVVENVLPVDERIRLFGEEFTSAIAKMDTFVVMLVTDFSVNQMPDIVQRGFVPRRMARAAHACIIASVDEFMAYSPEYWAEKAAKLVMFQRTSALHSKPLDVDESPFYSAVLCGKHLERTLQDGGMQVREMLPLTVDAGLHYRALLTNNSRGVLRPFPIGIGIYPQPLEHYVELVAAAVQELHLWSFIPVSDLDPYPALSRLGTALNLPIKQVEHLKALGSGGVLEVYPMPLKPFLYSLGSLAG